MRTIFALATARGKSGVAVFRLSGPDAHPLAMALCGDLPDPGSFALRTIRRGDGGILDRALVLTFASPRSFTGEDVVELHTHGSLAIIAAVEDAIVKTGLARLAAPGEFTQRALSNGLMDLPQVEGLSDLIAAETETQRLQAQTLLEGGLGRFAEHCRAKLLRAVALVEATIDFADEEVPVDVTPEVAQLLRDVSEDITKQLQGFASAERVRDGFQVAIVGRPNAGKSTLLNRIAGRDIAITSEFAGTTRDVLEVRVDLFGLPVTFLDTAGLRESVDVIEKIGVERALKRAGEADLRILLHDGLQEETNLGVTLRDDDLIYANKADVTGVGISALTGDGIDALLHDVFEQLSGRLSKDVVASHDRHRLALVAGSQAMEQAQRTLAIDGDNAEILALHIRDALHALDSLIGRVDVEAVLGEIFSQFCIGK